MSQDASSSRTRPTKDDQRQHKLTLGPNTRLAGEEWFAQRFGELGQELVFGGDDPWKRKERIRAHIKAAGLECVIANSENRKPVTFAQAFERLYGEKL